MVVTKALIMASKSVDTLVNKFVSEYPDVPEDSLTSLLSYNDVLKHLTAVDVNPDDIKKVIQSKPEGEVVATWLGELNTEQGIAVFEKLKVIATTAKLMDMIPENMRSQIEGMVRGMNQASPEAGTEATGQKTAISADTPQTTGKGASHAMNMINQMLNSGMLQQMQDMANEDADDMDMLKADVEQLKKESANMKRLINTIIAKLGQDGGKKKRSAIKAER